MGVAAITCLPTGDRFLTAARDTTRVFNRHRFQLGAGMHSNKALQSLWNQYGEKGFAFEVVKPLECGENQDPEELLPLLLELCLLEEPRGRRL